MLPHPLSNHTKLFTECMERLHDVPGDICEFGVLNGGSSRTLARFGRRVWAFDTYEGMPAAEFIPGLDHDEPGKFKPSLTPWEMFKDYPNVCPVQGRFAQTLEVVPPSVRVALAYLDCDLYVSYLQALLWLEKHLSPGAIVTFDDYGACPGARKAVDEWMQRHKLSWDQEPWSLVWSA